MEYEGTIWNHQISDIVMATFDESPHSLLLDPENGGVQSCLRSNRFLRVSSRSWVSQQGHEASVIGWLYPRETLVITSVRGYITFICGLHAHHWLVISASVDDCITDCLHSHYWLILWLHSTIRRFVYFHSLRGISQHLLVLVSMICYIDIGRHWCFTFLFWSVLSPSFVGNTTMTFCVFMFPSPSFLPRIQFVGVVYASVITFRFSFCRSLSSLLLPLISEAYLIVIIIAITAIILPSRSLLLSLLQ